MTAVFPLIAVFTLGALLYYGERVDNRRVKWMLKPATSALFLLTALAAGPDTRYDRVLFVGLVLCLFGDVFLISSEKKWFLAGLAAFLTGHVAYIVAFNGLAPVTSLNILPLAAIVLVSVSLFLYFRPHLGDMLISVIAYITVITIMLCGAWAVFQANPDGTDPNFRYFVAIGAAAFYLSDISVARDRFLKNVGFTNRLVGLPLYYLGQFLLALSIGLS